MYRDYTKADIMPEEKTRLENWAQTMCDACPMKNPRNPETGKVLNWKRAIDFPTDLLQLLDSAKIKLRGYNFCEERLEALRVELKPLLNKIPHVEQRQ